MKHEGYKVIVAHPGRQHSFRVATALKEERVLYKYITTVYDKEDSWLMKLTKLFLGEENRKRTSNRRCQGLIDDDVVQYNECLALLLLLVIRIDKSKVFANWLNDFISAKFQKKVAKYAIRHNVDAVISYDANCKYLFEILQRKAPHIKCIMDNAAPNRNYLYKVYSENMEKCGGFEFAFKDYKYLVDSTLARRFGDEVKTADFHIVASGFSAKALEYEGVDSAKIHVVPYGVDPNKFVEATRDYNTGILNLLYIGEVNQRKGIFQILEAAKIIKSPNIRFNIVGAGVENYPDLFKPYSKYVTFHGTAYFEKLLAHLRENHLFLFPSMGDGFGLVLLEAMAAGMPVIASYNSAAPDMVKEGENGFLINSCDTDALVNKILWCYDNMNNLKVMGDNARNTAKCFTWEHYNKELVNSILNILETEKQ